MTSWVAPGSAKPKGGIDWLESKAKARNSKLDSPVKDLLIKTWVALDESRGRSQQQEIGPSGLGGCRRQTFYKMLGVEPVNHDIDRLGALLGTAMHDHIEKAFDRLGEENHFNEITVPGIPGLLADGHIDFYDRKRKAIVDWKGSKLKSLRYFPSQRYRWQAMVYGYLARRAGYEVERIEIVAIPRDGKFKDIQVHAEEYDESVAEKALDWLREVKALSVDGVVPDAEPSALCSYCPFFGEGLCKGEKEK